VRLKNRNEAGKLYSKSEGVSDEGSHETLKRHSAFLTDGSGRDRRLRIHLFDTGRSPPQLIAHTCTAVDTCTVEERPM
jgi:hypothetical protein